MGKPHFVPHPCSFPRAVSAMEEVSDPLPSVLASTGPKCRTSLGEGAGGRSLVCWAKCSYISVVASGVVSVKGLRKKLIKIV